MNSRVTAKDIVAMLLIIVSFAATGIMIKNEDYKYALIALSFAAFCVLFAFIVIIIEDGDKILDLSNPSLRNPRKTGNSAGRVTYFDRLTPDMLGKKSSGKKKGKNRTSVDDPYALGDGDFYESVGNMKVYQRGEEPNYSSDDLD